MNIKIIKNRSDIGAGTRGSDMGIDAIEIAAINQNNDYFHKHLFQDVVTHNQSIYHKNKHDFAKRIEYVVEQCQRVADAVCENLVAGYFPIVLSGDHSSALGTMSGIKAANPDKKIGVIWIDAHADIHSPYTSPSGNIHGMPLAAAIGLDNLACKVNDPNDVTIGHWESMKNIGVKGPKLIPEHLIYFGVRDFEEAEQVAIETNHIRLIRVEELRYRGLDICVKEAIGKLLNCDLIYISFDVDSMDCDNISYGTGTPVPHGLLPQEVMGIFDILLATKKVCCIEFTEINPLLDNKGNKMAETAFQVLDHITNHI
jgi:arginase